MASRPVKTFGNTTYTAEVAASPTDPIKAAEVDGDFNEIYTNITNVNVAAGAGITYAKLSLTNGIVNADVNTAAAIVGTKLAPGAAVNTTQTGNVVTGLNLSSNTETDLAVIASITTRGGRVQLSGSAGVRITLGTADSITFRWYRGVTVLHTITSVINASHVIWALPPFSEAPAAGTYVYKITAQFTTGGGAATLQTGGSNAGIAIATELT